MLGENLDRGPGDTKQNKRRFLSVSMSMTKEGKRTGWGRRFYQSQDKQKVTEQEV